MPWKQDANGKWGNFEDQPKPAPQFPTDVEQNSSQHESTPEISLENQMKSSMELVLPPLQHAQEDLPEKKQPPYEGRWISDSDGEKMIYVVTETPPIPQYVIPLPAPPSDCGSCCQSDSSLTASVWTADPNYRSNTFDEIERFTHSQIIDSDNEIDRADTIIEDNDEEKMVNNAIVKSNTFGSGQKSKRSDGSSTAVETDYGTDDLEGQGYPKSIFRKGNTHNKASQKKRVTLVEPSKNYSEEKLEKHIRMQEKIRKTKRRERCCRKVVYVFIFLAILAIVIGGGLSAMVYFDVIDLEDVNLDFLQRWMNRNSNTTNDLDNSQDGTPVMLDEEESTPIPTASPTVFDAHDEKTFITDTLSGRFRIDLPWNEPNAPSNRAVDWMAKELKAVGKGHFNYKYDNLGKFGQRFAILTTQYSLLGKDVGSQFQAFSLQEQRGVDECDWAGVACDAYGRVIELDFSDMELTGKIPSEIQYLFKLETLDLSSNGIAGSIPQNIYDLQNLKNLYLYQNELTGTISARIGELDSLERLHLSHNKLSGSIPAELRSYTSSAVRPLTYLNLYNNELTGTIPNPLNLGNLFYFDIGRNFISGSIPNDMDSDYSKLKYLHIDHNRLTGSIPDTIPLMANGRMVSLLANNNQLSGEVPDNWMMFNKLSQYNVHDNYFDSLGPNNCKMSVFSGGNCVEFKADCHICICGDNFCDAMC